MWVLKLAMVENASLHHMHRNKSPSVKAFSVELLWYIAGPTGGNGGGGWDWGIVDERDIINQLYKVEEVF